MNQDKRKSRVESLSGGINGRQILVRFLLSLTVALLARGIYEGFTRDEQVQITAVSTESTSRTTVLTSGSTTSTPSMALNQESVTTTSFVEQDPEKALLVLAEQLTAKDRSKISMSKCGQAAVLVLAREVRFFKWIDKSWRPFTDLVFLEGVGSPRSVTTADYTSDGFLDFLISYSSANPQAPFVGAIFSIKSCAWNWLDFELSTGRSQIAPLLSYDTDKKVLSAEVIAGSGELTTLAFDETLRVFSPAVSSSSVITTEP